MILEAAAKNPEQSVDRVIMDLGLTSLSLQELIEIIDDTIQAHADEPMHTTTDENRLRRLMGLVMGKVRGRFEGKEIRRRLEERWREQRPESGDGS